MRGDGTGGAELIAAPGSTPRQVKSTLKMFIDVDLWTFEIEFAEEVSVIIEVPLERDVAMALMETGFESLTMD
jgi:hypothetical protein